MTWAALCEMSAQAAALNLSIHSLVDEEAAYHVLSAGNKVNTPTTQLSPVIGIMPPPIDTSVADVVHRCGS